MVAGVCPYTEISGIFLFCDIIVMGLLPTSKQYQSETETTWHLENSTLYTQKKRELSRAHIYPEHCICINLRAAGAALIYNVFVNDFDAFILLMSHSDGQILGCGDFRGDDDDDRQTKLIALPLAHARGVKIMASDHKIIMGMQIRM